MNKNSFKLATWNVNSLSLRWPQVQAWLDAGHADVLAVQETKVNDDKFPRALIEAAGYEVFFLGQKTYNGVALIARPGLVQGGSVQRNLPDFEDHQARLIAANLSLPGASPDSDQDSQQVWRVIGVYVPNGQAPGTDKFTYKMRWLRVLHAYLETQLKQFSKIILMGDFNITLDDRDVWDPISWAGQIHCTDEERAHLGAFQHLGFVDSFRHVQPEAGHYSWWDYRQGALQRNFGLRIDHIYVSAAGMSHVTDCWIDKVPRKQVRPSDHAPVVVQIQV
jgi:exodeoxyribonuclease-3